MLSGKLCLILGICSQSHLTPLRPKLHIRNSSHHHRPLQNQIKLFVSHSTHFGLYICFEFNRIACFVWLAFRSFRYLFSIVSKTYEQKHIHTFYLFVSVLFWCAEDYTNGRHEMCRSTIWSVYVSSSSSACFSHHFEERSLFACPPNTIFTWARALVRERNENNLQENRESVHLEKANKNTVNWQRVNGISLSIAIKLLVFHFTDDTFQMCYDADFV